MGYFIGIMSGTSLDGIDVVIVDFEHNNFKLIASSTYRYSKEVKQQIELLVNAKQVPLHDFCQLDRKIALEYVNAVQSLLKDNNIEAKQIIAIGCHGQTIKHSPNNDIAYTLQIGDPNTLSAQLNITTVADFRRKDIALGGQGAPLAPAFHQFAFQSIEANRAIINIGGITNITVLDKTLSTPTIGFDTGPGNTLIDHFCLKHLNLEFDKNGALASKGKANNKLLEHIILSEPFFSQAPAKSTGTDYFNLEWYEQHLDHLGIHQSPKDHLATLTELTALTISLALQQLPINIDEIYICGGGAHNTTLLNRINSLTNISTYTTHQLNYDADWIEAIAFAWFAKNTLEDKPSSLSSVTNSNKNTILGGIYKA